MKKRLFAILLALCLLALLFPLTASAVRLDWPHPSAHCVCGGGISNHKAMNGHTTYEGVYFTKDGKENTSGDISKMNAIKSQEDFSTINFNFTNSKMTTFYGYLANDVTITKQLNIADGCTFVLCLHGHTLTCNIMGQDPAFNLWKNARLVITDCQMSGDRGLITGDSGAAVYVPKTSTLDLYGVSICMTSTDEDGLYDHNSTPIGGVYNCGTFNMYGGCYYQKSSDYPTDRPVISNIRNTQNGTGVVNEGTFNMYDGIISGNARHGVLSTSIYVEDTINLYGGTITGNTGAGLSTSRWPAPDIYENTKYTTINLYGGTISENTGAGIDAVYGKVTMAQQSSAIPVEIKNNKGGAITLTKNGSTANLGTGRITGNSGGKGAVALSAGSLTLTGDVKITGNTGANLYLANGKTVTLDKLGSAAEIGLTTESTAVPVVFAEANGTDYTSRFTPDSAGYSIGYNAAQQLQLQTKTYPVTYAPGANGTGDSKTVNKEHDKALKLQGAFFTRMGYTQVGWSKHDGGEKDYSLNAIYEQNEALTLYPVWEERSDYTVRIVNRDGTTVKELKNVKWTDEIWKLLTPTPTRENGELLKRLLLGTSIVYGGDTYGTFATGGEDSLTFIAVWDDAFARRSTISVGDSQWTGYRADASERFFRDDQTVTLTVSHPEELLYFQYAVSDQLFENGSVAARKLSFVDYTGTFSTASLNLEEGKPYVIYGFLFTEFKSEIVINTDKIIIDKTAPTITGAKNGDVFCGEGDKTLTVTDRYLGTVTVNGTPVTPNEQGEITLTDARTPQTVVATDKAGNSTTLTVTVHSSHSYKWQTGNGQYWGECEFCGNKVEKKDLPTLTITSPDAVCRTQDFEFSFNLPEGCTDPAYSYEFKYTGDGAPITPVDGVCAGTIPAASYMAEETGFRFIASATTAEGYRFSVSKDITIREHSGGTATCTKQAVCDHCSQSYGALAAHSFTAETAEEQYLKSAATCTEKAVYYKSCTVCGTSSKGTADEATFFSGNALDHDWGAWTQNSDEKTHTRFCKRNTSHTETKNCHGGTASCTAKAVCTVCGGTYGEMALHSFTAEKAEAQYLKSAATCTEKAVYYKSCTLCGLSSEGTADEATFFSGNALDHDWGAWTQNSDEKTHTRFCKRNTSHTETKNCHGGTASCTAKAVCTVCGGEYGELAAHDFTAETAEEQYLKSAATCTEKAVYYKSCAVCGLSSEGTADEATFFSGNALDHDWGEWTSNEDGTHTRTCTVDGCSAGTQTENCIDADKDHKCDICDYIISECADDNKDHKCDYCGKKLTEHTGGKATCMDKAKCEVCGAEYGELDPKNHTGLKHFPAKAATKTTEGNIEYWYCEGCGKYFSDRDGTKEIKKADTVTAKLKDDPKSPQTGDTSGSALWIALLLVSGGAAIGTTVVGKKKKYNR